LLEERIRLRNVDAYGNEDLKKWIGDPPLEEKAVELAMRDGSKSFKEGIPYFWEKVILKKFAFKALFILSLFFSRRYFLKNLTHK